MGNRSQPLFNGTLDSFPATWSWEWFDDGVHCNMFKGSRRREVGARTFLFAPWHPWLARDFFVSTDQKPGS